MPELPEVETVKNSLLAQVAGVKIEKVTVNHEGVLKNASAADFISYLQGETIDNLERRGKYIIFRLSRGKAMIMHLRMTGQCVYFPDTCPEVNHCHVVLHFTQGGIYYRDVRRFGGFWIGDDIYSLGSGLENLGPEPLSDDFSSAYLWNLLKDKKSPVKSILLDQSTVAGIGNIYADEITFAAGINPLRPGVDLTEAEAGKLVKATKGILSLSIEKRGTTFSDYRDGYGSKGGFQEYLKVFQRGGEACFNCGSIIQKTKCGGRGTSFCPHCQPYANRRLVVGLTGGIACGKTMVSEFLHSLGAEIIDADIIAREIVEPGSKVLTKIGESLGNEFIAADGSLNRKLLRDYVFQSPERVKKLNSLTHPAIRRRIGLLLRKSESRIIFIVAPLLLEAKYDNMCDEIWLIKAGEDQQLARLMNRDGINEDNARSIIDSQWSYAKKEKYADFIIDNSGSFTDTEKQVEKEYQKRKNYLYE